MTWVPAPGIVPRWRVWARRVSSMRRALVLGSQLAAEVHHTRLASSDIMKTGISVSTYTPKAGDTTRTWHVIDATDVVLGRLAVQAATLLRGKHKPTYCTQRRRWRLRRHHQRREGCHQWQQARGKFHYHHSGHPGGLKSRSIGQVLDKNPDRLVEKAIMGMIPKNKLGNAIAAS